MRISSHSIAALLWAVCAFAAMGRLAHAGAPPACITATLSANNNILVLNDLAYDDPDETHPRMPRTSTFRVLHRYVDVNEGLRMNGPNAYWQGALWSLVLPDGGKTPLIACPYTLVTDDGEFLLLVNNSFGANALSIYRRRDHPGLPFGGPGPDHGVLIRQIALPELWPRERIPVMITDHTPQWFSNGSFVFSPDNRKLIYQTAWGKALEINLETGQVCGK